MYFTAQPYYHMKQIFRHWSRKRQQSPHTPTPAPTTPGRWLSAVYPHELLPIICLAIAGSLHPLTVQAQPPADNTPADVRADREIPGERNENKHRHGHAMRTNHREQLQIIEQFIDMPPERIARIRRMLEHIENMTPEERQRFKANIQALKAMPLEKRSKLFNDLRMLPTAQKVAIRRYLRSLPAAKRQETRHKFRSMSAQERKLFIEKILEQTVAIEER